MYQVHDLCYCKYVHRTLNKIKLHSKIEVRVPLMFLIVLERNLGMEVVTHKTF